MNKEELSLIGSLVSSAIVVVLTTAGMGPVEERAEKQRTAIAAIREQLVTEREAYATIRSNIWNSAEVQNSVRRWSGDEGGVSNVALSISMMLATNQHYLDTLARVETNLWLLGDEMWCPYTWRRIPRSQINKVLKEGLHREELLRQVGYPVRQWHCAEGNTYEWKYATTEGDTCTLFITRGGVESWTWSKEDATVGWRGKDVESILLHFREWLQLGVRGARP
jgi:hypothetical protein